MTREQEIEAILVDTYSEDEEASSWEVAFQEGVAVPFAAALLDIPVTVLGFRMSRTNALQCQVRRHDKPNERWVGVEDLDKHRLPEDLRHILGLYRYHHGEKD